jgi:hypothetical protein
MITTRDLILNDGTHRARRREVTSQSWGPTPFGHSCRAWVRFGGGAVKFDRLDNNQTFEAGGGA